MEHMDASVSNNLAEGEFFTPGSYWKEIHGTGKDLVEDGLNVQGEHFHAPTNNRDEVISAKKKNFAETFDRPVYTGNLIS